MKYYKLYTLIFLIIYSCSSQRSIEVDSKPAKDYDVIGWYNPKSKKIDAISFPFILNIRTSQKELLHTYQYMYNNKEKGAAVDIYYLKNNKLELLNNYEERPFSSNKKKKLLLYTRHMIFDTKLSNELSSEFIKSSSVKDSFVLGLFDKFNNKFSGYVKDLIQKDTLYLRFKKIPLKSKSKIKRVKVPIEF